MGLNLPTPEQEYWSALKQWKITGMLVNCGCTDYITTNIDAFLDFVLIQSMFRNPYGETGGFGGRRPFLKSPISLKMHRQGT